MKNKEQSDVIGSMKERKNEEKEPVRKERNIS
jgi:hypothetical protein